MAEGGGAIAQIGGEVTSRIFGSILWFGITIIVLAVILGIIFYYVYYRRKFDIMVKIISERLNDDAVYFDKGGVLKDRKDGTKYLRLLDTRVDLPYPPYFVMHKTNKGHYLEIWRKSEDEFIYLSGGHIDKTQVVKNDGQLYEIGQEDLKQLEGDIAYWNVKRKEKNKGLFSQESLLMKLMPYIPIFIVSVFGIFILYILMDSLPQVLAQLKELSATLKTQQAAEVVVHG